MSDGLLFVIAPKADHKAINRILLHLRDWEYGSGDRFKLVHTKNAYDLGEANSTESSTSPPIPTDLENSWAGAPLTDVEAYCLDLDRSQVQSVNTHLYIVVDAQGLEDKTCILGERAIDEEAESIKFLDRFNKVRLPWREAYITWCNLDIGNMDFMDFVVEDDDEADDDEDDDNEGADQATAPREWWTRSETDVTDDDGAEARDAEIERLRAEGRA